MNKYQRDIQFIGEGPTNEKPAPDYDPENQPLEPNSEGVYFVEDEDEDEEFFDDEEDDEFFDDEDDEEEEFFDEDDSEGNEE